VDIAAGLPTALTLACADGRRANALQQALSTPTCGFTGRPTSWARNWAARSRTSSPSRRGPPSARGWATPPARPSSRAAFAEMTRVATAGGARQETLTGLSGLGDLVLTCGSEKSRNFRFGAALATWGRLIDPDMTVEGVHTARRSPPTRTLDTPIADVVAAMADGTLDFAPLSIRLCPAP
jgi:glycerol-3-phosphate dehydrogenase (NAD(P)+)